MTNKHLNEIDIQEYLLNETYTNTEIIEHIQHCEECRLKAEQYKLIFEVLKIQEKPIFDFNLADLVLKQLPGNKPEFQFGKFFVYCLVLIVAPIIGVLIYLFSTSLSGLVIGIAPILVYLIVTTVIGVMLFQCFDTYTRYKNRMNALNFY